MDVVAYYMTGFFEIIKTEKGLKTAKTVGLAGLSATFLFCGYEFIRSTAESVFLSYFPAESKLYALSCVPFVMALLIYLYGRLLSYAGAARAMVVSILTSALVFTFIFFSLKIAGKWMAFFLFIFKESYVVILSEQYWSFINSAQTPEEAKAFNGPVAGLGALGSLIGGFLISRMVGVLHTEVFILLSATACLPALLLILRAYKYGGEPAPAPEEAKGKKGHLHLSILKENRTVLFIALVIFAAQVVATLLDIRFSQLVKSAFADKDLRTAFLGDFWMKVNIFSFSMQFVFSPLLLSHLSVRRIQIGIPLIHVCSCLALLLFPSLFAAGAALLLFKGLDYSVFRASKETLYIPFSYDTRYRAKQIADAFTYRFSKGLTSIGLSLASLSCIVPAAFYPAGGMAVAAIWSVLAIPLTAKPKISH